MGMQQKIEKHWNSSADNYGSIIRRELDSFRRKAWAKKITENAPDKPNLSVLDIGTGPGFFPIVLGELGHNVMAIDCTENMLEKAKKLAQSEDITADFLKMDSHALSFEDNTFDLLINRERTVFGRRTRSFKRRNPRRTLCRQRGSGCAGAHPCIRSFLPDRTQDGR